MISLMLRPLGDRVIRPLSTDAAENSVRSREGHIPASSRPPPFSASVGRCHEEKLDFSIVQQRGEILGIEETLSRRMGA